MTKFLRVTVLFLSFAIAITAPSATTASPLPPSTAVPGTMGSNESSAASGLELKAAQDAQAASRPSATRDTLISPGEVAALRVQNELIKTYQSDLLDTVHWSLGVAVGLTLLLAGFGWFTNYKLYEADKASLKESFESRIIEFEQKLESALSQNKAETLADVGVRLDSHAAKLASDISTAEGRSTKLIESVQESVAEVRQALAQVENQVKAHTKALSGLERNLRIVELEVWEIKDIPVNLLITQAQALGAAVQEGSEYFIKHIVSRSKDTLQQKFVARDLKVDKFVFETLSEELDKVEKVDAVGVAEVRKLLESVRERSEDSGAKR